MFPEESLTTPPTLSRDALVACTGVVGGTPPATVEITYCWPTSSERVCCAVLAVGVVESDTVAVNEKIPEAVGMPLITPVEALRVNPPGSEFEGADQV
jgi:hypothetical protein